MGPLAAPWGHRRGKVNDGDEDSMKLELREFIWGRVFVRDLFFSLALRKSFLVSPSFSKLYILGSFLTPLSMGYLWLVSCCQIILSVMKMRNERIYWKAPKIEDLFDPTIVSMKSISDLDWPDRYSIGLYSPPGWIVVL